MAKRKGNELIPYKPHEIIEADFVDVSGPREKNAKPRPRPKRGRPTRYTQPLAKAICKMLASGMTLNQVCARPRMPPRATVIAWHLDPAHPFGSQYARAREAGYYAMADELIEISDDNTRDFRVLADGRIVPDHDHISRSRLRVDTRKWLLAKCLPKIFGERQEKAPGDDQAAGPRETPRETGQDHLAALARRYGGGPSLKVVGGKG